MCKGCVPKSVKCAATRDGICVILNSLVQYTGNTRPNLNRFFAFSNTPVGGIGNVHKKLRLSSVKRSKNDKIRFFLTKSVSFGSVEVAMGEDLVEILVSFSF